MNSELNYADQLNPQPEPPAPAPRSFFSRLIGVYFSPGETFQEIGRAPGWLAPMLTLAIVGALGAWVMIDRIGVERFLGAGIEKGVENGRITREQADQQMEGIRKGAPLIKASFPIIGFVVSILMVLAIAGVAKLGSMMFGVENDFKPLLAATAYALLAVGLVGTILLVILLYLKSPDEIDVENLIGSNLTALLGMAGVKLPKFLHYLFTFVDVFVIWRVILLGIAFAGVSRKLKTSTAITYTATVTVLIALVRATWGAIFG